MTIAAVILGIVLLIGGGTSLVHGTSQIATRMGVSPMVVGLTVVAFGTSMPELVTSIIAAARKESDLALGNIVGSNLFNTLLVLPSSALVSPFVIPSGGNADLTLSLVFAASLIPIFVFGNARLGRRAGVGFLVLYVGWAVVRVSS